ncbi:hypothetical protein MMC19_002207 [Ptychographa xylographoides]|nr:hypothetical protein [Ptychographa xylographoides]
MPIKRYIEYTLSTLLSSVKGNDAKLFTRRPAFKNFPKPSITVDSPECGPSGSHMSAVHSGEGEDRFPHLEWTSNLPDVKQYLLICEDADTPLPFAPSHGIFYHIPASKTTITASDIESMGGSAKTNAVKGGFKHGKNVLGTKYGGPMPLMGHGSHRYFYQVIALIEPIDKAKLSAVATKAELAQAVVGKVAGWGAWVGVYERKWE